LQKTKDGKIVIFHDERIERTSNGVGKIEDYTYKELLQLDFGSWFNNQYKGEKIVLFENFAKEFLSRNLTFAIELKTEDIEKEVLEIIHQYVNLENIYITSFEYKILENVRKLDKTIKISWLIEENINEKNIKKLLKIKGSQICPEATKVSPEDIELAHKNGLGVRLWGVTNEEIMKKVYSLDIEGMTVNFPDKLNLLREENKATFADNIIYETENFVVTVPKIPHIPREDGGHLIIREKNYQFESRSELIPKLAIEVMRLTMLVGDAMKNGMKNRNIEIERINYQENGNWTYQKGAKPVFHIHLYGRTKNATTQTWGEALVFPNKKTGFYDNFEAFNEEDIKELKKQLTILEKNEKYNLENWKG